MGHLCACINECCSSAGMIRLEEHYRRILQLVIAFEAVGKRRLCLRISHATALCGQTQETHPAMAQFFSESTSCHRRRE